MFNTLLCPFCLVGCWLFLPLLRSNSVWEKLLYSTSEYSTPVVMTVRFWSVSVILFWHLCISGTYIRVYKKCFIIAYLSLVYIIRISDLSFFILTFTSTVLTDVLGFVDMFLFCDKFDHSLKSFLCPTFQ